MRVAVLANFTADLLGPVLAARALPSRLLVRPYLADFDTWAQELAQAGGSLDEFDPEVVVLSLRLEALQPDLTARFLELSPERVEQLVEQTASRVEHGLRSFRQRSRAKVSRRRSARADTPPA